MSHSSLHDFSCLSSRIRNHVGHARAACCQVQDWACCQLCCTRSIFGVRCRGQAR
ncbi:hypothetical protein C8Q70DRAFT_1014682 [Cubamyces menziesii]|nr:hypothetical protein C8Q70DRAFT_1014682 [Cubamyces menziesii]